MNQTKRAKRTPLVSAYDACEALARSHYENFPVASRLLPAPMRPHVTAVYAFARVADDIADEGSRSGEERRQELDRWQKRLHQAIETEGTGFKPGEVGDLERDDLILLALAHSIRSLDLPVSLFDDLLSAFGQDTTTNWYASWDDLLDYCRRSANPVGRLVLRIAGRRDADLDRSSDALCTALQLTNFWQDFGRDWCAGRMYVPREVQDQCGARETDLQRASEQTESPEHESMSRGWMCAIEKVVVFTRTLFKDGRFVCEKVGGRLGIELKLTWLGGSRVLDRVEAGRARLLMSRPTIRKTDALPLLWRAMSWRAAKGTA